MDHSKIIDMLETYQYPDDSYIDVNDEFIRQIRTGARRPGPAEVQKGPRGSHPRVTGGPRPGVASAPRAPPHDALWPINHPRRENPNPRRIFPNTIQSSASIADKFRGFRTSCSGTLPGRGSTVGAISINTSASRDEEGVVPHRGCGLYK